MLFANIKKSLFIIVICSFYHLQANYQAEHYVDFDENTRYQFLENQNLFEQLETISSLSLPFQPLLEGLLQGIHPYQLLVADLESYTPYFLIKSLASYVYLVGKPNKKQCQIILQELSLYKNLVLICDESVQTFFVQHGFSIQPRIECMYNFDHQCIQKDIPARLSVQRIDLALFKQSLWFGFLSSVHGGAQRFLDIGFGYALVNEQSVPVAMAFGAFISKDSCEIGVITHPEHRGKGYIVYPTIAVMQECFEKNITPVWSCNSENIASLKTAVKLGFDIKRHYVFLKKS